MTVARNSMWKTSFLQGSCYTKIMCPTEIWSLLMHSLEFEQLNFLLLLAGRDHGAMSPLPGKFLPMVTQTLALFHRDIICSGCRSHKCKSSDSSPCGNEGSLLQSLALHGWKYNPLIELKKTNAGAIFQGIISLMQSLEFRTWRYVPPGCNGVAHSWQEEHYLAHNCFLFAVEPPWPS